MDFKKQEAYDGVLDMMVDPYCMLPNYLSTGVRSLVGLIEFDIQSQIIDRMYDSFPNRFRIKKAHHLSHKPIIQRLALLYGNFSYLDDAIDCIWERIQIQLGPAEKHSQSIWGT